MLTKKNCKKCYCQTWSKVLHRTLLNLMQLSPKCTYIFCFLPTDLRSWNFVKAQLVLRTWIYSRKWTSLAWPAQPSKQNFNSPSFLIDRDQKSAPSPSFAKESAFFCAKLFIFQSSNIFTSLQTLVVSMKRYLAKCIHSESHRVSNFGWLKSRLFNLFQSFVFVFLLKQVELMTKDSTNILH